MAFIFRVMAVKMDPDVVKIVFSVSSAVPALLMLHSVAINVARSEATWRSLQKSTVRVNRLPLP